MEFRRLDSRTHTVVCFLLLGSACKGSTSPSTQHPAQASVPTREVRRDAALLFTYVEPNGMFATADKADKVPEIARRLVRVMGLGKGEAHRRNDSNVEVIDVRELLAIGKTQPRVMSREAFESGALAQLPPGDSCPLAGPHGSPLAEDREESGGPDDPPIVILYATRWCKACKAARQYLVSNRIPFIRKDIEKDPSAAHELQEKASRFGIPMDRVPILDVRGRLLVGYDETRMDGYLADW